MVIIAPPKCDPIRGLTFATLGVTENVAKEDFIAAMHKEVASVFKDEVWKVVPREEMVKHFAAERKKGVQTKR